MKKSIFIAIVCFSFLLIKANGQSLPSGTCGIVYTYDATGNRTKSEFILNNTQTMANVTNKNDMAVSKQLNEEVIKVDALFPNPTTGQITVRLVKVLQNANVQIMDVSGRVMLNATANGSILNYDLSRFASGVYFLCIQQGDQKTTLKVIRR